MAPPEVTNACTPTQISTFEPLPPAINIPLQSVGRQEVADTTGRVTIDRGEVTVPTEDLLAIVAREHPAETLNGICQTNEGLRISPSFKRFIVTEYNPENRPFTLDDIPFTNLRDAARTYGASGPSLKEGYDSDHYLPLEGLDNFNASNGEVALMRAIIGDGYGDNSLFLSYRDSFSRQPLMAISKQAALKDTHTGKSPFDRMRQGINHLLTNELPDMVKIRLQRISLALGTVQVQALKGFPQTYVEINPAWFEVTPQQSSTESLFPISGEIPRGKESMDGSWYDAGYDFNHNELFNADDNEASYVSFPLPLYPHEMDWLTHSLQRAGYEDQVFLVQESNPVFSPYDVKTVSIRRAVLEDQLLADAIQNFLNTLYAKHEAIERQNRMAGSDDGLTQTTTRIDNLRQTFKDMNDLVHVHAQNTYYNKYKHDVLGVAGIYLLYKMLKHGGGKGPPPPPTGTPSGRSLWRPWTWLGRPLTDSTSQRIVTAADATWEWLKKYGAVTSLGVGVGALGAWAVFGPDLTFVTKAGAAAGAAALMVRMDTTLNPNSSEEPIY